MTSTEPAWTDLTSHEPTWQAARAIAQKQLHLPTSVTQLIRLAWTGAIEPREFLRMLSFSRLNLTSLIGAADLNSEDATLDASLLIRSLHTLGIRYAAVVLAVNHVCQIVLNKKPPASWIRLFKELMTWVEIGYRVGAKASALGLEGGALIGFSRFAGDLLLLSHDPAGYRKWSNSQNQNRETAINAFGCEPYQVSAFALQQLGFGHEVAIGAALGNNPDSSKYLSIDQRTLVWKAAILWIEALREGRGYPADPEIRQFFSELIPPKEPSIKNPVLDVLYTEVARAKSEGSNWTWHLPKTDYEQTAATMGPGAS